MTKQHIDDFVMDKACTAGLSFCRTGHFVIACVIAFVCIVGIMRGDAAHAAPTESERQTIIGLAQAALSSKDDEALKAYREALRQAEIAQDYLAAAALHNAIGEFFEDKYDQQTALLYYEQGREILRTRQVGQSSSSEHEPNWRTKGYAHSFGAPLGVDLYRGRLGDLRDVFAKPESDSDSELQVLVGINAGNMYLYQNQYERAERYYQHALAEARNQHNRINEFAVLVNLAWSAIRQRNLESAEGILQQVLSAASDISRMPQLRTAVLALGVNQREQGNYRSAIANLEKAVALYKVAGDTSGIGRALPHLGTALLQQGDADQAKQIYLEALQLNESLHDPDIELHGNVGLARVYDQSGDYANALRYYRIYWDVALKRGLSLQTDPGRTSYFEDHDKLFEDYARAAVKAAAMSGDYGSAREVIEQRRARILMSLESSLDNRYQSARRIPVPGHLPASYVLGDAADYEIRCGAHLERVMNMSGTENEDCSAGIRGEGVEANRPSLPQPSEGSKASPLTYLEYYVLEDQIVIFVKTGDGEVHGTSMKIAAAELEALVDRYLAALGVKTARAADDLEAPNTNRTSDLLPSAEDWESLSQRLQSLLVEPVARFLPSDPGLPVVVVPHRDLWRVPFASLQNAEHEYFSDLHLLTFAASEATWRMTASRQRQRDHRHARAWIAGNPRMPESLDVCGSTAILSKLPSAQAEAEQIAALFKDNGQAALFVNEQADRLRLQAWYRDFTVLHLATHGFACPDRPLDSFVLLADVTRDAVTLDRSSRTLSIPTDERLPITLDLSRLQKLDKSWEKRNITLDHFRFPGRLTMRVILTRFLFDADLITLSACQTGLGRLMGEGMIGFPRAFLASGARSLLASLWSVDDEATKDLMIAFYRQYLEHGNKGIALQRAMRETRARYPSPASWAAFVLYGLAE